MAKLLIVEDHLKMAHLIQDHIYKINTQFTPENTFCFSPRDPLKLCALDKIPETPDRTILVGKKDVVFSEVFQFLDKHADEQVLILIDVLLNSQNISAPSIERYRADHEYSCELYAELLRVKNRKPFPNCSHINPDNFYHIIYSRSDSSIGVVVAALDELSRTQEETDREYFPRACAQFENISWCRNEYDVTDPNFGVADAQKEDSVPLALPSGYIHFIKSLM